jgi:hypothetical protein
VLSSSNLIRKKKEFIQPLLLLLTVVDPSETTVALADRVAVEGGVGAGDHALGVDI